VIAFLKLGLATSKLPIETQRDLLDFFTKSAAEVLEHYFEDDTVKALFGFDAVVGHFASPYEPGTAYVLLHHVFGEAAGVREAWGHAIGGMGAITQAMRKACEAENVDIITDCTVEEIICSRSKVIGVTVAASVHPKILYQRLLDEQYLDKEFKQRIQRYKSHSGTFRMNLALESLPRFERAPENPDFLTSGIIIALWIVHWRRVANMWQAYFVSNSLTI